MCAVNRYGGSLKMERVVLVTGGAGYIGSHACKRLFQEGYTPVTFDNLSKGWREAVKFGPFFFGDLRNKGDLNQVFKEYNPTAIFHFAGLSEVGASVISPIAYWENNLVGSINLIEAASRFNCTKLIFSSTCATYGDHGSRLLHEQTVQQPVNPYGSSKRAIEDLIRDHSVSHDLKYVIFRYFNVAGADPSGDIGEHHIPETHLIPLVLDAIAGKRESITIYGTDYDTKDGTCVRDYVHVCDLIDAHFLGLKWLESEGENRIYNLGSGCGYSVLEVLNEAQAVTRKHLKITNGARRAGDCAKLLANPQKAFSELNWDPKLSDMNRMIADAWRWHQRGGYEK